MAVWFRSNNSVLGPPFPNHAASSKRLNARSSPFTPRCHKSSNEYQPSLGLGLGEGLRVFAHAKFTTLKVYNFSQDTQRMRAKTQRTHYKESPHRFVPPYCSTMSASTPACHRTILRLSERTEASQPSTAGLNAFLPT
jgi:hypothetical protein